MTPAKNAWLFIASAVLMLSGGFARAQTNASDDAAGYYKSANWTNGANQGFGFTPWVLATNSYGGGGARGWYLNNGYAIASPTIVNGVSYPNCSWGIYANGTAPAGGNRTVAYRGFASPLTTNVTFKLQWMTEGIGFAATNHGGFVLRNGNSTASVANYETGYPFELFYVGGGTDSFQVKDGNGTAAVGIPFGAGSGNASGNHLFATGLTCEFTLQPGDTYRLIVRSATTGEVLAFLDNRPLAGTGGSTIDSAALYANETVGSGTGGGDQNFNRMQIVSTALVPPAIANVRPADGARLVNPQPNVYFEVVSAATNLLASNVTLVLNSATQTLAFNTSQTTTRLLVTNTTSLATNLLYHGTITVTATNGITVTHNFDFDTYQTNYLCRDIDNYGAAGNGTTMDTTAIQNAINACAAGGFVWLHNGTFYSGTIVLKNNMTLYIDPTATLLGSSSATDYPDKFPALSNSQTSNCRKALVYAESCTNITVTGGGTINGNGRANFRSGVEATRPIAIWTTLCQQVRLQNFDIVDAGMWTCVNMQTDYLNIKNVDVDDDGLNGNRDGFDVVDCWHVVIEDCIINSGDDSICIKSGNSARGVNDLVARRCTITRSQSNALKFGTASKGPFTNILFQDCLVLNTDHSVMAVESVDGSACNNITFERITFSACQNAIFIVLGIRSGATVGSVDGIVFRDITGSAMVDNRGCPITGLLTNGITTRLKNLLFDNVNITYPGGAGSIPGTPAEYAGQYPENTIWASMPAYGYYVRHATNVVFTNCFTSSGVGDARPWIASSDVSNLKIFGPTLNALPRTAPLVLQWDNGYTLQTATNINGVYADVPGVTGLYTNQLPNSGQRYFRLRQ
ncbi:MAG: glycosyl hydrolase family 28 protein [Verrucomicrobia bacterium]|nr:glycosyl hydrolase family 28 protein [Verrucomicrobiota bacterium]